MPSYTNPYTGQTISPSQVGYESLTISTDTTLQWPINGNTTQVVANIVEVTATVGGLKLYMPAATQVSVGQSALIKNIGANTFTVVDQSGNTIVAIASGIAEYVYITNNSTEDGTWTSVTFGAGTSTANAGALAGAGLKAISTTLNTATPVTIFSSNYTFTPTDRAQLFVWTGGVGTITLAPSGTVGSDWFVIVKNDGAGVITIVPQGGDLIDGQASAQLQISESFVLVSDGLTYYSYAYGQSSQFVFTQLVKNVTGGTVVLTAAEAASIIQEYQGALLSNCTVVVPQAVQLYSFRNNTTNAFSLTFTTGVVGGLNLILAQGDTVIAICDGTNIYNAQTAAPSLLNSPPLGNGTSGSPSLNFVGNVTTGLYLPLAGQLGFTINGTPSMRLTGSGLFVPVGINAGAF